MAKQNQGQAPQEVTFSCQISVPSKYLKDIGESVKGEDPLVDKVTFAAEGALLDLCEGGLMLNAPTVRRMTEACGKHPEAQEVLELVCKAAGRVNGNLEFTVSITPEQESMLQQVAEFQGSTLPKVVQDIFDYEFDQGNLYEYRQYLSRVLMLNSDKESLVKILGKDFSTGTELAKLVLDFLKANESPFAEVEKQV